MAVHIASQCRIPDYLARVVDRSGAARTATQCSQINDYVLRLRRSSCPRLCSRRLWRGMKTNKE